MLKVTKIITVEYQKRNLVTHNWECTMHTV